MKRIIAVLIFISFANVVFGQTLEKKWDYLLEKSNSYKSHKVIKSSELSGMWEAVQDTMGMMRAKVKQEQKKVSDQQAQIDGLNNKIKEINGKLSSINEEKSDVLASAARADIYISSLLIALGIVVLICLGLFFMYKKSNAVTNQKKHDYDLLQKSFEEYKTAKLEVERKLKREIQTYMNKVEEMKLLK